VKEDSQGPFHQEAALAPKDEEVRLASVLVMHQVEGEGGTVDKVSNTPLRASLTLTRVAQTVPHHFPVESGVAGWGPTTC